MKLTLFLGFTMLLICTRAWGLNQESIVADSIAIGHFEKTNSLAQSWHLSRSQWQQYQHIIHTSAIGSIYAKRHLDPNIILALASDDPAMIKNYVRQAVINEHSQVSKLLAINALFEKIAKARYGQGQVLADAGAQKGVADV